MYFNQDMAKGKSISGGRDATSAFRSDWNTLNPTSYYCAVAHFIKSALFYGENTNLIHSPLPRKTSTSGETVSIFVMTAQLSKTNILLFVDFEISH